MLESFPDVRRGLEAIAGNEQLTTANASRKCRLCRSIHSSRKG